MRRLIALVIVVFLGLSGGVYALYKHGHPNISQTPSEQAQNAPELTAKAVIDAVNATRSQNNIPALTESPELDKAAQATCADQSQYSYYGDTNPTTGAQSTSFITQFLPGNTYNGVNMTEIGTGVDEAVNNWLNSPPHKANMLNVNFDLTGAAICSSAFTVYRVVVQDFSKTYVPVQPAQKTVYVPTYTAPSRSATVCYTQYSPGYYPIPASSSTLCN
jgi:hypothetical protein